MKKRAPLLYILFILAMACNIHCKVIRIDNSLLYARVTYCGQTISGQYTARSGIQVMYTNEWR